MSDVWNGWTKGMAWEEFTFEVTLQKVKPIKGSSWLSTWRIEDVALGSGLITEHGVSHYSKITGLASINPDAFHGEEPYLAPIESRDGTLRFVHAAPLHEGMILILKPESRLYLENECVRNDPFLVPAGHSRGDDEKFSTFRPSFQKLFFCQKWCHASHDTQYCFSLTKELAWIWWNSELSESATACTTKDRYDREWPLNDQAGLRFLHRAQII